MYPIFFKRRLRFQLAALSLSVGTPAVLVPQFGLTEGWLADVFLVLFLAGFFYLVWFDELFRIWSRGQKNRIAKRVAVRGLQIAFVGFPFLGFDFGYAATFHSTYSYQYLVRSIGGPLFSVGMVATSIGLVLDWRRMPGEVDSAARQALQRLKECGFALDDNQLWVGIDSRISSTGFSFQAGDESVILVKPWEVYATGGGGLSYTLTHEMCHIYLYQTKHPSHNSVISREVYDPIAKRFSKKWQYRILGTADDYPAEVFTDDLAFKVYEAAKGDWAKRIIDYFQDKDAARRGFMLGMKRRMWRDALLVLRTAFFQAQMERYQMPDPNGTIRKARDQLLSSFAPTASEAYAYFHNLFLKMRFEATSDELRKTQEEYLTKFVTLAEEISCDSNLKS